MVPPSTTKIAGKRTTFRRLLWLLLIVCGLILLSIAVFGSGANKEEQNKMSHDKQSAAATFDWSHREVIEISDEEFQNLVGKFVSSSNQPNAIARSQLPKNTRVIPPNSVVTMDFDENRLNVHIRATGEIWKVKRG